MTRGLMIAALRSGSGKTTATLGLLRAFRRRGVDVVGLKSGPDYIDPAFHAAASGREGVNLDSWAMSPKLLAALAAQVAAKSELALCEASMGLFDGVPAESGRTGASADVAAALGMPVLLVLDVIGQAQSAAAVVKGCGSYDPRLSVAGVIVNRVGSERHRRLVVEAIEAIGVPVVGALPRNDKIALPERHLGLVQAGETHALEARLEAIADFVETHVDCGRVLALAGELDWASLAQEHFASGWNRQWPLAPPPPLARRRTGVLPNALWWGRDGVGGCADRGTPSIPPIVRLMQQETGNGSATPFPNLPHKGGGGRPPAQVGELGAVSVQSQIAALAPAALRPPGQRIALARDVAFSFIYPHLVHGWRAAGAEIVPFSPLADEPPPDDCDLAWLPGGYPELHAGRLAAVARFREGLRRFAETRPVHGECGGYMALGESLIDAAGVAHPMAGLLGVQTSFAKRRMTLGYREARIAADCALGTRGMVLRGHEFHYATIVTTGSDDPFAHVRDVYGSAEAPAGSRRGRVTGSFFHVIAEG